MQWNLTGGGTSERLSPALQVIVNADLEKQSISLAIMSRVMNRIKGAAMLRAIVAWKFNAVQVGGRACARFTHSGVWRVPAWHTPSVHVCVCVCVC